MILFTCLTFNFIDGYNTIRANDCARCAADAVVIDGMGIVVALTIYIFRQFDAVHGAGFEAYATAFATLGVDNNLSFKCHNVSFIRLIFTIK